MLQPLLVVATLLWVGGCCYVCARVHARQRSALPSDATMKRLRRSAMGGGKDSGAATSVEEDLGEAAPSESTVLEERVLREVLRAANRPLAVLAINELSAEVSRSLQDARTLPSAVSRVALLGGTAIGFVAIALALQHGQGATAAMWGGVCWAVALGGAVVCEIYGKLSRRAAERRREGARDLIRLLERRLPAE